jgi:kynurenine formamidase
MNEHTGTHFDAPVHWVSGRDVANGAVDEIDPGPSSARSW